MFEPLGVWDLVWQPLFPNSEDERLGPGRRADLSLGLTLFLTA